LPLRFEADTLCIKQSAGTRRGSTEKFFADNTPETPPPRFPPIPTDLPQPPLAFRSIAIIIRIAEEWVSG
jgi:hypothetical protein